LVLVNGNSGAVEVHTNKIYIFEKPPSDLKPVARIMTISEGNLVSHVSYWQEIRYSKRYIVLSNLKAYC